MPTADRAARIVVRAGKQIAPQAREQAVGCQPAHAWCRLAARLILDLQDAAGLDGLGDGRRGLAIDALAGTGARGQALASSAWFSRVAWSGARFSLGIRYFIVPESAAYTFGLAEPPTGYEMHYIIALRNVWLGLLAIAFVLFRQWYALALWFGLGVFVCFADAAIAASSSGGAAQVAFHMSLGVLCAGLALLLGRIAGLATIRA